MMLTAELAKILAPEQYGSRKFMRAIDHALNKRLVMDIARQKKIPAAICSCDLKSCYDRIGHAFASLAMQRGGAPIEPIICMFETIQKLIHSVRTGFGDSFETFGGEFIRQLVLQGVGQGNGAGPSIWALVSSVLFDILRKKGYGIKIKGSISGRPLKLAGFGFVDDTDLVETGSSSDTIIEVAEKLQESIDWWERGANASGGALTAAKSWGSLIDFTWNNGDWEYTTDFENNNLRVKESNGEYVEIDMLKPTEAKKMLGVYLAVDGNNRIQVEIM